MNKKKKTLNDFSQLVYSTDPDAVNRMGEDEEQEEVAPSDQLLTVHFEKKHRAGKPGTLIKGFEGSDEALQNLARELKSKLATGGTVKDGEIFIQGMFRDRILAFLQEKGFKVKRVGG
ncbi:MAG: translation initiation factor [Flavobacteriales bacterium]|nr:translation initiation factor [Flavobacteriales bacterium]MCB9448809.1 translation initiation factor [Flavobacteriales bacterium]